MDGWREYTERLIPKLEHPERKGFSGKRAEGYCQAIEFALSILQDTTKSRQDVLDLLKAKMKKHPETGLSRNREEGFEAGIGVVLSMLSND